MHRFQNFHTITENKQTNFSFKDLTIKHEKKTKNKQQLFEDLITYIIYISMKKNLILCPYIVNPLDFS